MAATQSKPRKAAKKATAPRKAARNRASETETNDTNGSKPEFQPLPDPPKKPEPPAHPYGADTPVYIFSPADGSAPIIFPKIGTLDVTAKFMWRIYNLNEMFQSFEWMNLANVPRPIQERVVDLPLADRTRFWAGWFQDITAPQSEQMGPPGE